MSTLEDPQTTGVSGDLLGEHRAAWAAAVCGEDAVVLDADGDVAGALADATAAVMLDGYEARHRAALAGAATRGVKLVIALRDADDAAELAGALDGEVVPQRLLGGSLIGDVATAEIGGEDAPPLHHLVVANAGTEAVATLSALAGPELSARVARLEQALEALQEANVRLAREQLGRHDAAAGTVIGRLEQRTLAAEAEAREWQQRFEFEQQLAMTHHEWYMDLHNRLQARRYLIVDRVRDTILRIPGVKILLRLRG